MTIIAPSLCGAEQPLTEKQAPRNDEVIAVFRNGAVVEVAPPGRRVRPLFYRPRPGNLTYARILRSDIVVSATVPRVALADPFVLPQVSVTCRLALYPGDAGDYAPLVARLQARGLRFTEIIAEALQSDLDALVRDLCVERTHDDIMRSPRPTKPVGSYLLLDGLFVVESIDSVSPTPDPEFERRQGALAGVVADDAVFARQEAEARRLDALAAEQANFRGLSISDFESPALAEARRQREHDVAMIEAAGRIELAKMREQTHQIDITTAAQITVAQVENVTALSRAKGGRGGIGPGLPTLEGVSAPDSGPGERVPAPEDLARDSALLRHWNRATNRRGGLLGAVRAAYGQDEHVVLVLDQTWWEDPDALRNAVGLAYPGLSATVLPRSDDLSDWIRTLAADRARDVLQYRPTYAVQERGDDLAILVASETGQARAAIRAINDPATLVLPALRELLPYDDIALVPAGSGSGT